MMTLVLCALLTMPMWAGKTEKEWNFTLNEEAECILEYDIPTNKDAKAAITALKSTLNRQTFEERSVISEEGGTIVYQITKNTKTRYNPFAGNFNESMKFKMEIRYENGTIKLRISDLVLINTYEGFGKKTTSDTFSGKISTYEEYQEALNSGSLKGKEKKEAESKMEEISDSLNECQLEMDKLISAITKGINK